MKTKRGSYLYRVGIGFDQFVNTIFGGDPDETISAKAYRKKDDSVFWKTMRVVIDGIFFWQPHHCYGAYQAAMRGGYKSEHYKHKC